MKECSEENFRREGVLALCLVSLQRRVEVLNLLGILLDLGLILLILLRLSDHHSLLDWSRHHRVLSLRIGQCQRSIPVVASFIQGLVVCHNYAFSVDRQDMSKGSVRC